MIHTLQPQPERGRKNRNPRTEYHHTVEFDQRRQRLGGNELVTPEVQVYVAHRDSGTNWLDGTHHGAAVVMGIMPAERDSHGFKSILITGSIETGAGCAISLLASARYTPKLVLAVATLVDPYVDDIARLWHFSPDRGLKLARAVGRRAANLPPTHATVEEYLEALNIDPVICPRCRGEGIEPVGTPEPDEAQGAPVCLDCGGRTTLTYRVLMERTKRGNAPVTQSTRGTEALAATG